MSAAFLDLAKSVFQVHGVDAQGKVVVTKRLRRGAVLAFFCVGARMLLLPPRTEFDRKPAPS